MNQFSKHTPCQIVVKLEQADRLQVQGMTAELAAWELGISIATLNRWRRDYGQMPRSEAKELKTLRE